MVLPPWAAVVPAWVAEEEGEVGDASEHEEEEGDVSDASEPAEIMALRSPCPVCMKEFPFKRLIQHLHQYAVLIPLQSPNGCYQQFKDPADPHRDTLVVVKALHQVQQCVLS
jgi:hypothetical protein